MYDWDQNLTHDEWVSLLMKIVSDPETRDSISTVPERLLWKLYDSAGELSEPNWLAFVLQDVGRCALKDNDWHKALWLKRLGELYLADICSCSGYTLTEVYNHKGFQTLVQEFAASREIDFNETSQMLDAVDQLYESGNASNPFFRPALLYLPLMRLCAIEVEKKGGDRLSASLIAMTETKCFTRAGLLKDAKNSFDWSEPRLTAEFENSSNEDIGLDIFWVGESFRKGNEPRYSKRAYKLCQTILPENHDLHKELWGIRASAAKRVGDAELESSNPRRALEQFKEARSLLKIGISKSGDDCEALLDLIEFDIGMVRAQVTGELKHLAESFAFAESSNLNVPSGIPAFVKYAKLVEKGEEPTTEQSMAMVGACLEIAKQSYEKDKPGSLDMLIIGFSALAELKHLPDGVSLVLEMASLAESCKTDSPKAMVEQYSNLLRVMSIEQG